MLSRRFVGLRPRPLLCRPSLSPGPAKPFKAQFRSTGPQASRRDRILSRVPSRLQKYTNGLRNAPLSHIIAFLILHEITAVVPLLGLWGFFHYTDYVPLGYVTQHWGKHVRNGVEKAERYFRRKGWFGFSKDDDTGMGRELAGTGMEKERVHKHWEAGEGERGTVEVDVQYDKMTTRAINKTEDVLKRWAAQAKYRVVVEVALAWAITKALLPVRIVVSVWATPWLAGVMGRATAILRRR